MKIEVQEESDKEIEEIEGQIKNMKAKVKATTSLKKLGKLELTYQHLLNKKKETLIMLRKKYKIKIEGDNVPDL